MLAGLIRAILFNPAHPVLARLPAFEFYLDKVVRMFWHEFLLIAGTHFLALLSPGPDFLLVLRSALTQSRRHTLGVCLGIALANGIYILCALAGFSLLRHNAMLLQALKWAGCAWLIWIAWQFVRGGLARKALPDTAPTASTTGGLVSGLLSGLGSGGFNPKNALFYLGLFTLAVSPQTPLIIQTGYGLWMVSAVFLWDWLLAMLLRHRHIGGALTRHLPQIEISAGVILLGLAVGMALDGSA